MMDLLDTLLSTHGPALISAVTERSGISPEQAERFVPAATGEVGSALSAGGLDLGALLGGDLGSLLSQIDIGSLAESTGLAEGDASSALTALVDALLPLLKEQGGGLGSLAEALGGQDVGGLLSKAGKLFGS